MMCTSQEADALKAYVENFSTLFPVESTIRQVKLALDLYREEYVSLLRKAEVPRVLRDALPSIRGQIEGRPYGEPAPLKKFVKFGTGGPAKNKKHTPKAGVPPGAQWRVATSLVQAINKEKLYSTEEGEPKQVDDPEEAISENKLRHALQFDEYAIAKVLSLCEFSPEAIVAVGYIEDWTWDVTKRFLLSSELVAYYWKELRQQQGSKSHSKSVYGIRRLLRSGQHLGRMLEHVRNIARNPPGDSYSYEQTGELELWAHPYHDAGRELSDFYHTLSMEQPLSQLPEDLDAAPDSEVMAALQLEGGRLGRISQVIHTLMRTSLGVGCAVQPEQPAALNPWVSAAAASAGYLPAAESCESTAVCDRAMCGDDEEEAAHSVVLPPQLSDSDMEEFVFEAAVPRDPPPPQVSGPGTEFGSTKACARCGVFMCERHCQASDALAGPNAALTTYLLDGASGAASLREDVKWHKKEWEEPCSSECYKVVPQHSQLKRLPKVWTQQEKAKLAEWVQVYGRNPCSLADLFHGQHTCRDIHTTLHKDPLPECAAVSSDEEGDPQTVALQGSVRRRRRPKVKPVTNGQQPAAIKRSKRNVFVPWSQYVPCNCDPEKGCNNTCACAQSQNFCEKHCKCGGNCRNAHQGCKCKGSCTTNSSCPCLLQQRECDPSRCVGCCPTAHGTVQPGGVVCQNMNLLLGVTRRLAVGLSEVAGWGCFVMEDIKEGEYIGEYTGELLHDEECERRGAVYDRRDTSYLFTLNDKWAVDAQKVGNKLRFANHKRNANAAARVMMLNGDHHVGIYAKTNLPAGTEIFYDYGYASGQGEQWCPDWAGQKG